MRGLEDQPVFAAGMAEHCRVVPSALHQAMVSIPRAALEPTFRAPDEHCPVGFLVMRELICSALSATMGATSQKAALSI